MRIIRRCALALTIGACALLPSVAYAVAPVDIDRNYEDYAEVSTNVSALSNLMVEVANGNLWVITVDDFDGMSPDHWAMKTFDQSGLSSSDGLLVISVGTSELYAYSPDGQIKELLNRATSQDVLDKFHDGEWDAGITLFAEHVRSLRDGDLPPAVSSGSSAPNALPIIGVIGLVGAGVVGFAFWKKRKTARTDTAQAQHSAQQLAQQASAELLAADDDVRSGAAELEFARVEFGVEATEEFRQTLLQAQDDVHQAFELRRLLDDDEPETPTEQHSMNTQILTYAQRARSAMQAQAQQFSQLRNLVHRLDSKLDELTQRHQELLAQVPLVCDKVSALAQSIPPESVVSLESYPSQISSLLTAAQSHIASARQHQTGGDENQAVQYARLAEGTLEHVSQLVARVDQAPQLLAQAQEELKVAVQSLSADIADAQRLGGSDTTIALRRKEAEEIIARATASSGVDLLVINDQLAKAERNLDIALASVRAQAEQEERARLNITRYKERITAKLQRLDEDITRYRELVSADTRTLLHRAHSTYESADTQSPAEQLQTYTLAMDYATRAERALTSDVDNYRRYNRQLDPGAQLGGELAGAIITGVARSLMYGAFSSGSGHRSSDWSNNSFGSSGGSGLGKSFGSDGGGFGKTF